MKIEPHKHRKYYESWKNKGCPLPDISEDFCNHIISFLKDWETGNNRAPGSKKGARDFGRLRNLKTKLYKVLIIIQEELKIKTMKALEKKERDFMQLKTLWDRGELKNNKAENIRAVGTYFKSFSTFWHWYQRINQGREVPDIMRNISTTDDKPKFHYITQDQLKQLMDNARYDYKVYLAFSFYSGARPPTEVMNTRVCDFENLEDKEKPLILVIRDEVAKTFGRKNKLIVCSNLIREYIRREGLKGEDYLFTKTPQKINQYLKRLAYRVLKIGKATKKGADILIKDGLSMYDLRHSGACFWLPRYQTESALKYRFGWKKSEMIHYYTEFLGMKDTIQEEHLYIDVTKSELENQLIQEKQARELMEERMEAQEKQMEHMKEILMSLSNEQRLKEMGKI